MSCHDKQAAAPSMGPGTCFRPHGLWSAVIHPHQRCGYSDLPFARKDTFLYCRVQKWVKGGGHRWAPDTKRKLYLRKRHFFVIEKYIEDAKQKKKDVPDLLEAIMRPACFVKEELRQNLFKLIQFRPKITKIRVCTFQMSGKIPDSSWTSPRAPLFPIIWPH